MNRKYIIWALLAISSLHVAFFTYVSVYARRCRPTSNLQYDGAFKGRYVINDPSVDLRYIQNPLIRPYCETENAILELEITSTEFNVTATPIGEHGHTTVISSVIGENIFYLGNGLFEFFTYESSGGQILPGLSRSVTVGKIRVSKDVVSVEVERVSAGSLLFVIPGVGRQTFKQSIFREKENEALIN